MSGSKQLLNSSDIDGLLEYLEEYSTSKSLVTASVNPQVESIINLSEEELKSLTQEECLFKAFILSGYCGYVQKIENKHKAKLNWCQSLMYKLVVDNEDLFTKYMKWDQKLHVLAANDEFANTVMQAKLQAESNTIWLENKVRDLRKQVDVLLELGRRRF